MNLTVLVRKDDGGWLRKRFLERLGFRLIARARPSSYPCIYDLYGIEALDELSQDRVSRAVWQIRNANAFDLRIFKRGLLSQLVKRQGKRLPRKLQPSPRPLYR